MKGQPEQKAFTLLCRGRACRVWRTLPGTNVDIQFSDTMAVETVARSEVSAPDGYNLKGPDV